jgi:hypothetical protein
VLPARSTFFIARINTPFGQAFCRHACTIFLRKILKMRPAVKSSALHDIFSIYMLLQEKDIMQVPGKDRCACNFIIDFTGK